MMLVGLVVAQAELRLKFAIQAEAKKVMKVHRLQIPPLLGQAEKRSQMAIIQRTPINLLNFKGLLQNLFTAMELQLSLHLLQLLLRDLTIPHFDFQLSQKVTHLPTFKHLLSFMMLVVVPSLPRRPS